MGTSTSDYNIISDNDRDAMQLAIDLTLAESDENREHINRKLAEDPWREVGHFCSYHRQYEVLNLLPWQSPPCDVEDPDQDLETMPQHRSEGRHEAALLTKEMLSLGISRFHPDPI